MSKKGRFNPPGALFRLPEGLEKNGWACPNVDVVLRSSDGIELGAHSRNLESYNTAFPSLDSVMHRVEDRVELTESYETLRLLLEFSHNCKHSDLRKLDLDAAIAFGNAAEKYGNFFALETCLIAMRDFTSRSSLDSLSVLAFRSAHGELEEIERLAGRTMDLPPSTVWKRCKGDPTFFYIWTEFREQWRTAQKEYYRVFHRSIRVTETEKQQLKIIRSLAANVDSRFAIDILDNAVANATQIEPPREGNKFLDDYDMSEWYSEVKKAISEFPSWEAIMKAPV
ncbi:hypothetical protein L218DRAFT_1005155 [Marasmius fiardii PR-910]|nr:hypothetical protein L218DRAFT_1005155 [Marasmius fiardii PR-910]